MSGVAVDPATPSALDRFLRTLAARDASPHTQRSYATAIGVYLDWLAVRGVDWRTPGGPTSVRTSVSCPAAAPGRRSHSAWRPSARSTGGLPATAWRPATRGVRSPRPGCPAACPGSSRPTTSRRCWASSRPRPPGGTCGSPDRVELATALALRDRALVETAYAAGLRISELADAELGALDLRRGELRVIGKGRKERVGLLGRPARAAMAAYLEDGRPTLVGRRGARATDRRRRRMSS